MKSYTFKLTIFALLVFARVIQPMDNNKKTNPEDKLIKKADTTQIAKAKESLLDAVTHIKSLQEIILNYIGEFGFPIEIETACQVKGFAMSPKGDTFATRTAYGIKLWNLKTAAAVKYLKRNERSELDYEEGCHTGMCYSPDGKYLAFQDVHNELICVKDTETNTLIFSIPHSTERSLLQFTNDGTQLLVSRLGLVNPFSGTIDRIQHIQNSVLSPDNKYLIMSNGPEIIKIDTTTRMPVAQVPDKSYCMKIFYAPDGKTFATTNRNSMRLWNAEKCTLETVEQIDTRYGILCYSADSKRIYIPINTHIIIWEIASKKIIETITERTYHDQELTYIACSHDGKYLVCVSADQIIRIFRRPKEALSITD